MKLLLLGFTKVKFMPYAHFYLQNIDKNKNEVHLVYWNRDLQQEDLSCMDGVKTIEFRCFLDDSVPKKAKLVSFFAYRRFVKKIIKKGSYDFIISLHSLPGLLVLDILKRRFRKQYILDYRDSTFEEKNRLFAKKIFTLASNARLVFTSSDAFRKYLPSDNSVEVITSHNLLVDSLIHRDFEKSSSDKIRIAFWGLLRHTFLNKLIIEKLANDTRFELHYYGRELACGVQLRTYCEEIRANNIFFHGEYQPEDRYEFARNTDLLHNIYLDSNTLLAMGNKYYDGIIFRIPQLCMPGSFMGELIAKKGLGLVVDPSNGGFADMIAEYYYNLNRKTFSINCNIELDRVMKEYNYGQHVLNDMFNK